MKMKATLITMAILAVVGVMVALLVYGGMNNNKKTAEEPLPSMQAAKTYALDHKLLASITDVKKTRPGGPVFQMVSGKDASGQDKLVWLAGKDNNITKYGDVLLKDGLPRSEIIAKLKEKNIPEENLLDLYVTPHDYTSGKIVWFAQEKGDKKHMLWFDFQTGDQIWEGYQDPTAWKLGK